MSSALLLLSLLLASPGGVDEALELDLGGPAVSLELWGMELDVEIGGPATVPLLELWSAEVQGATPRLEELAVVQEEGWLRVVRHEVEDGLPTRWRAKARLRSDQGLRLLGHDLDLRLVGSLLAEKAGDGASPSTPAAEGPAVGVEIAVEASEAEIVGLDRGGRVWTRSSTLSLRECRGSFLVQAEGAKLDLEGLGAGLTVEATDTELEASSLGEGAVIQLTGGHGALHRGQGRLQVTARDATLAVEGWRGALSLGGESSVLEIRDLPGADTRLDLRGRDLDVTVDGTGGKLGGRFQGGRARISGVGGQTDLLAFEAAELLLERLFGPATVQLDSGSRLVVRGCPRVRVEARESEVEANEVERLEVKASLESRIQVSGRSRGLDLQLTDSELQVTDAEVGGRPTLVLAGASSARVELPLPCTVEVAGGEGLFDRRVEIVGCDLLTTGGRSRPRIRVRGRPPVQLHATVGEDAYLEVEGIP